MERLAQGNRREASEKSIRYVRVLDDVPVQPLTNVWDDTKRPGDIDAKQDVVQTSTKVIERCLLMTTDPGDLVVDPTCGSGTTAYVAEPWGRRWITIDTSRVAIALARQRLLTATFPFYKVKNAAGVNGGTPSSDQSANPAHGFEYKTVPHITLRSIAQNVALDAIFARHHPILDETLAVLNAAWHTVTPEVRQRLAAKLLEKETREGKKAITDADRRRWQLPKEGWKEWEVPFDADEEWTPELKAALTAYRAAWRAKMDEVNACIAANAEQEELVDQPEVVKGMVRVSGPFTVEAVMPVDGEGGHEPVNADAYLDHMIQLLRGDGVRFPNNQVMRFARLEPRRGDYVHAEGEWQTENGQTRTVAVSFGPQYGPVTAFQVENALPQAMRGGFDDLVFAGFSFDAAAQAIIHDDPNPRVRGHLAHIRPDVNMGDLLKETPSRQRFTVFGSPRTEIRRTKDGQFVIDMQGVDIYHPGGNTILPTSADNVAAWFVDTDDDGRTFGITQAFFPDRKAWDKLARARNGVIDEGQFAARSGTVSLPFPAGPHQRAAVKVIDPRGHEVMRVHHLGAAPYQR